MKAVATMRRCYDAGLALNMKKSEVMAVIMEALEDHAEEVEDAARELDPAEV